MNGTGPQPTIVKIATQQTQNEHSTPQIAQMTLANPYGNKDERGKAFRQVLAAFIVNLGTINTGLVFGFSAVVIPQLKLKNSLIPIDENQASWIGKFPFLLSSVLFTFRYDADSVKNTPFGPNYSPNTEIYTRVDKFARISERENSVCCLLNKHAHFIQ